MRKVSGRVLRRRHRDAQLQAVPDRDVRRGAWRGGVRRMRSGNAQPTPWQCFACRVYALPAGAIRAQSGGAVLVMSRWYVPCTTWRALQGCMHGLRCGKYVERRLCRLYTMRSRQIPVQQCVPGVRGWHLPTHRRGCGLLLMQICQKATSALPVRKLQQNAPRAHSPRQRARRRRLAAHCARKVFAPNKGPRRASNAIVEPTGMLWVLPPAPSVLPARRSL